MIVAGGGIIGLSCAWRLAQRGVRVTVFDAREIGAEASWAGAGMLSPGGEAEGDSPFARMALASLAQYAGFVEELQSASEISIDFRRCGAMEFAFSDMEAAALDRRAVGQAAVGIHSEAMNSGCRFYPDDALVDPRDVVSALRIACVREGVTFREHEPVREITGEVLIAAGPWSSALLPATLPCSVPVRGHLLAFDGSGIRLDHMLRHGHTYIVQRARTGRIIAGSSTEHVGFDRRIEEVIIRDIHRRAARLLPALADLKPSECWNGFRPALAEGTGPLVGRVEGTDIWTAYGHYRNGILLAPETARIITAKFMQDREIMENHNAVDRSSDS
jgi:glycine oxidase